jgi:hypothetical protein
VDRLNVFAPGRFDASEWPGALSNRRLLALSAIVVTGLGVIRLVTGGWDSLGADHARYVYAGMSLLDGHGYVNESGNTYLLRAPAYPLMVGGAFAISGANGAHLVAWGLGLGSLLLAIEIAARLGGSMALLATTVLTLAVAQFWEQLVSLGIDLPQAAFYLAAVLLLWQPKPGHWLLAGGLLGIALLIKETIAPAVVLLPIAWLPVWSGMAWRRWAWHSLLFLLAVALVAGWWWFLVWRETGLLFPLNSIQAIVPDEDTLALTPTPAVMVAGLAAGAAWVSLLVSRFRDPGVRLIAFATLALAPAVTATVVLAQPARNLTAVVLLSCVAAGTALSDIGRAMWPRASGGVRRAIVAAIGVALVAGAAIGQLSVARASADPLPADTAAVMHDSLVPGDEIIATFRYRSALGVELFDEDVSVRLIPVRAVGRAADPSEYLWLGERRGTLFGLTRDNWHRVIGSPRAAYLVLISPHPLTPAELLPALRSGDGRDIGLTFVKHLSGPAGMADVFEIRPDRVGRATQIHLHAQPGALVHWLDIARAAGASDASDLILAARPVVPARARGLESLADRLGAAACFRPRREDDERVLLVEPADRQGDCLSRSALEGDGRLNGGGRDAKARLGADVAARPLYGAAPSILR